MNYTDSNPVAKKYLSNKRSFSLEYDTVSMAMEEFDTKTFGELMEIVFKYELYGEITPVEELREKGFNIIFRQFKRELDYKREKYLARCSAKDNQKKEKEEEKKRSEI